MNTYARFTLLLISLAALASGCGTAKPARDLVAYRKALDATDPVRVKPPAGAVRDEAVQRFVEFYRVYSADVIRKDIRSVYAADAYFLDPFHEMTGVDTMETYFLRAAEPVQECTFDITDWAEHDGEYYFRWIMKLSLKRDPKETTETLGLTHVRFNEEGKVVFHADYWDPQYPIFDKIPMLSGMLRYVRGRITGE